jgi:peroxiredoxin
MSEIQSTVGLPRLNAPAPNFSAKTTHGDRSLADYKGKWLVLFSHPSDFTPVCTTEFIGFAGVAAELKSKNCELLGLSIDSIFSHIAWTRNIAEKFGVEIPFPIIEDLKMDVARAYGMIHPGAGDTSAVRATCSSARIRSSPSHCHCWKWEAHHCRLSYHTHRRFQSHHLVLTPAILCRRLHRLHEHRQTS